MSPYVVLGVDVGSVQQQLLAELRLALAGRQDERRRAILVLVVDDHGAGGEEGLQPRQVILRDVRL